MATASWTWRAPTSPETTPRCSATHREPHGHSNLGTLASGAAATVTVIARPTGAGQIQNTASVTTSASDSNPVNNSAAASTKVVLPPKVTITLVPGNGVKLSFCTELGVSYV